MERRKNPLWDNTPKIGTKKPDSSPNINDCETIMYFLDSLGVKGFKNEIFGGC